MEGASETATWIQTGGLGLFGLLVLYVLREFKRDLVPVLAANTAVLSDVKVTLSALLERERMRGERVAAADAQRRMMLPPDTDFDDPPTNPIAIPIAPTRRTSPHGVAIPSMPYGPKKPGSRDG